MFRLKTVHQDPCFCFEPDFGVFFLLTLNVCTGFFPQRDKKKILAIKCILNYFTHTQRKRERGRPDPKGRDEGEKRRAVLLQRGVLLTFWGEADTNT